MKKKIAFFETEDKEKRYFKDRLDEKFELMFFDDRLDPESAIQASNAHFVVVFIYSDLSQKTLDLLPKLKGISTMSVGTDHIDLKETRKRKILVSNVPSYGPNTVAEHAAALLLTISRNIIPSVERTKETEFDYAGLSGWDLYGKTVAVIGTGKIGQHFIRIANGLGMKIVAYDPKPNLEIAEKYQVKYLDLDSALKKADVVSLHVPLTSETKNLIDAKRLSEMKKGVVIINTARGGLIDSDALLDALESGQVSQAGLDVLPVESLLHEEKEFFSPYFKIRDYQLALASHALMRHENVIVTPHNAFNSKESLRNILGTTVDNLNHMAVNDPINVVD